MSSVIQLLSELAKKQAGSKQRGVTWEAVPQGLDPPAIHLVAENRGQGSDVEQNSCASSFCCSFVY